MSAPLPQSAFKIAIIGGGISGIAQAVTLKRDLGDRIQITLFEKRSSLGGVWRDAKWPGAGVDVPIHLYSLFSDLKSDWSRVFAEQPEVLAYWESLVDKHDLRGDIVLNTEYIASKWDESEQNHVIQLRRGDGSEVEYRANVIISANGPLSNPTIPKLPGLETFAGDHFHNLHWDDKIDLCNKRVAVIGNGSSGIQLVPGVAEIEGVTLTHFIRSGGYFIPKINESYGTVTKLAFKYVPLVQRLYRFQLFRESNDRWRAKKNDKVHPTRQEIELLDYLQRNAPPQYLDALTPKYPLGCKRVAFDAGWLRSLHRPNVELVNVPIARVQENGLVTIDGQERAFDVIIFATGSNVAEHGVGLNVGLGGRGEVDLQRHWKRMGGPQAYMGTAVPEFPNYFMILGPNAIAGSWGYTIGCKSRFNAKLVKAMLDYGIDSLEPTEGAFIRNNEQLQRDLAGTSMVSTLCDNWWRVGGNGLLSVPNSVTGFRLAELTNKIVWNDWNAVAVDRDTRRARKLDISTIDARRKRRNVIALGTGLSILIAAVLQGGMSWVLARVEWR